MIEEYISINENAYSVHMLVFSLLFSVMVKKFRWRLKNIIQALAIWHILLAGEVIKGCFSFKKCACNKKKNLLETAIFVSLKAPKLCSSIQLVRNKNYVFLWTPQLEVSVQIFLQLKTIVWNASFPVQFIFI